MTITVAVRKNVSSIADPKVGGVGVVETVGSNPKSDDRSGGERTHGGGNTSKHTTAGAHGRCLGHIGENRYVTRVGFRSSGGIIEKEITKLISVTSSFEDEGEANIARCLQNNEGISIRVNQERVWCAALREESINLVKES